MLKQALGRIFVGAEDDRRAETWAGSGRLGDKEAGGLALDAGVRSPLPSQWMLGVALLNLGPGLTFIEDSDLTASLDALGDELEKLIPAEDEQELLRRYRKSDAQSKELILQLIAN